MQNLLFLGTDALIHAVCSYHLLSAMLLISWRNSKVRFWGTHSERLHKKCLPHKDRSLIFILSQKVLEEKHLELMKARPLGHEFSYFADLDQTEPRLLKLDRPRIVLLQPSKPRAVTGRGTAYKTAWWALTRDVLGLSSNAVSKHIVEDNFMLLRSRRQTIKEWLPFCVRADTFLWQTDIFCISVSLMFFIVFMCMGEDLCFQRNY